MMENQQSKKTIGGFFASLWAKIKKRTKDYFAPKGIQEEMMRYRPNTVSFFLAMFGFCCFALAQSFVYSNGVLTTTVDIHVLGFIIISSGILSGIDVVVNILLMLFLFLAATQMKNYSRGYGIASIAMGAFQVLRIFLVPIPFATAGILPTLYMTLSVVFYIISGGALVIAGVLSVIRGRVLRHYLSSVKTIENEIIEVKK